MTDYLGRLPEVIEWLDSLKEHAKLVGYVVGSTVEAERELCAYCGDEIAPDYFTCSRDLCEDEYWKETNAETLRGG